MYTHVAGISLHGGGGDDNPNIYDICTCYIHMKIHVYMLHEHMEMIYMTCVICT